MTNIGCLNCLCKSIVVRDRDPTVSMGWTNFQEFCIILLFER